MYVCMYVCIVMSCHVMLCYDILCHAMSCHDMYVYLFIQSKEVQKTARMYRQHGRGILFDDISKHVDLTQVVS